MKKILYLFIGIFTVIALSSCDDSDEIRKNVDELHARLDKIQPTILQFNKDLISYKAIVEGSTWITNCVVNERGDYTVTFYDETEMTIYKGAVKDHPQFYIDAETNTWHYTLNDEDTEMKGMDGSPIKATGTDGQFPQIRISDAGVWQYSFNNNEWISTGCTALPRTTVCIFEDVTLSADGNFIIFSWMAGEQHNEVQVPLIPAQDIRLELTESADSSAPVVENTLDAPLEIETGKENVFNIRMYGVTDATIDTNTWAIQLHTDDPANGIAQGTITITASSNAEIGKVVPVYIKIFSGNDKYCSKLTKIYVKAVEKP